MICTSESILISIPTFLSISTSMYSSAFILISVFISISISILDGSQALRRRHQHQQDAPSPTRGSFKRASELLDPGLESYAPKSKRQNI